MWWGGGNKGDNVCQLGSNIWTRAWFERQMTFIKHKRQTITKTIRSLSFGWGIKDDDNVWWKHDCNHKTQCNWLFIKKKRNSSRENNRKCLRVFYANREAENRVHIHSIANQCSAEVNKQKRSCAVILKSNLALSFSRSLPIILSITIEWWWTLTSCSVFVA